MGLYVSILILVRQTALMDERVQINLVAVSVVFLDHLN